TAMGRRTTAATGQSLSIGRYNDANTSSDGTLFVVGNGTGDSDRSDALVLDDQGEMTIAGTLTENSDRRLKTSIEPLGDGTLTKLAALQPVRYEFKNQRAHPSGEQIGLVAQEVQKKFPELVSEGSGGMLSLAYPKLSAVLLKGLQEQQATIETQQARIDSLTRRVDRLAEVEREVADLRAEVQRAASATAGWSGSLPPLLLAALVGGLLGAGLLHLRRR
ncbi:MAG: tail fiber domain-containing protein, partial [Salinivenus sp.]